MLRRGLAAFVSGMILSGTAMAGGSPFEFQRSAPATRGNNAAMNGRSDQVESAPGPGRGVQNAVSMNHRNGNTSVRQTAAFAENDVVYVNQNAPVQIQNPPVVPNTNPYSGPQMFSAMPVGHGGGPVPVHPGNNWQQYSAPVPAHQTSAAQFSPISHEGMPGPVCMTDAGGNGGYGGSSFSESTGQYPQTGAALYPAPVPGIPWQVGGTSIPNQAFHPHEMLYAHRYRAMYPPYYYKVNGGWMVTPFGVWSHEDWRLQGTTVDVNYRSHISPFSLYRGKGH